MMKIIRGMFKTDSPFDIWHNKEIIITRRDLLTLIFLSAFLSIGALFYIFVYLFKFFEFYIKLIKNL